MSLIIRNKLTILALIFFNSHLIPAQEFRFIVWGDTQFQNESIFDQFIQKTELLNPKFVLHVGDMIHGYNYSEELTRKQWSKFFKQITPLSVPFYPTPGNHDITTGEMEPVYNEIWQEKSSYYSFEYRNSFFIILNLFENQEFYKISLPQEKWLIKTLQVNQSKKNIFISLHPPLHLTDSSYWNKFHQIFVKSNVRAVFTGHSHIYDFQNIDGIDYFCLNTSGNLGTINNHLAGASRHILMVDVDDDRLNYSVITTNDIVPHDIVNPNERARAKQFWENNKTISFPDISNRDLDTTVSLTIKNQSDITRIFKLHWQSELNNWSFEPCMQFIEIEKFSSLQVSFRIKAGKGNYLRKVLPKLMVESVYTTLNKIETSSKYFYQTYIPLKVNALFTNEEIKIDGNFDEQTWHGVEGITNLFTDIMNTQAKEKTNVKIAYDDNNIYVAINGEEPNPMGLLALAHGELPLVFGDDDYEIFFDSNRDLTTFFRLMVNPAGTILSSGPKGRYSFNFEVKTKIGENFWNAEFKIPFSEFDIKKPVKTAVWGFNVRRHRQQAEINQSDWSKMENHPPYQPEYFGLLIFN